MNILTDDEIKAIDPDGLAEGFARAIESAVLEKLKAQEPIGVVKFVKHRKAPDVDWEVNVTITRGMALYAHPLPPDDVVRDAERYRFLRDVGQEVVEVFIKVKGSNAPNEFTTWHGYSDMDAAIDSAREKLK